jgi:hypothetical protein
MTGFDERRRRKVGPPPARAFKLKVPPRILRHEKGIAGGKQV